MEASLIDSVGLLSDEIVNMVGEGEADTFTPTPRARAYSLFKCAVLERRRKELEMGWLVINLRLAGMYNADSDADAKAFSDSLAGFVLMDKSPEDTYFFAHASWGIYRDGVRDEGEKSPRVVRFRRLLVKSWQDVFKDRNLSGPMRAAIKRKCTEIINEADASTLKSFVAFLEEVGSSDLGPEMKMAKKRLSDLGGGDASSRSKGWFRRT